MVYVCMCVCSLLVQAVFRADCAIRELYYAINYANCAISSGSSRLLKLGFKVLVNR